MRLTHNYNKTEKFSHKTLFYVQNKNDTTEERAEKKTANGKKKKLYGISYTVKPIKHINMKYT